jgi:hypothetical protein
MKTPFRTPVIGACLLIVSLPAGAGLFVIDLGTSTPPSYLGGHYMSPFPANVSPEGTLTYDLAPPSNSPVIGPLLFSTEMVHLKVTSSWSTWSHGYKGSVYHFDEILLGDLGPNGNPLPTPVSLNLPGLTQAFSFYLEPAFFGPNHDGSANFQITATTAGGLMSVLDGNIAAFGGARGVGIYTDDPFDPLASLSILGLNTWPDGWATGEFAINGIRGPDVPDLGSTLLIFGLGVLGLAAWSRRSDL